MLTDRAEGVTYSQTDIPGVGGRSHGHREKWSRVLHHNLVNRFNLLFCNVLLSEGATIDIMHFLLSSIPFSSHSLLFHPLFSFCLNSSCWRCFLSLSIHLPYLCFLLCLFASLKVEPLCWIQGRSAKALRTTQRRIQVRSPRLVRQDGGEKKKQRQAKGRSLLLVLSLVESGPCVP